MSKYTTCQGCLDRAVGCHGQCDGYQARVEVNRVKNEDRRMCAQVLTSDTENAKRIRRARGRETARKARRLNDTKI